jgi:hypothetical protein
MSASAEVTAAFSAAQWEGWPVQPTEDARNPVRTESRRA